MNNKTCLNFKNDEMCCIKKVGNSNSHSALNQPSGRKFINRILLFPVCGQKWLKEIWIISKREKKRNKNNECLKYFLTSSIWGLSVLLFKRFWFYNEKMYEPYVYSHVSVVLSHRCVGNISFFFKITKNIR